MAPITASSAVATQNTTWPGRRLDFEAFARRWRKQQNATGGGLDFEAFTRRWRKGGGRQKRNGVFDFFDQSTQVRHFDAGGCSFDRRQASNLNQLLTHEDEQQRCTVRHLTLEQAGEACGARAECVGVVRDNGIRCANEIRQFELRGGFAMPQRGHVSWVCASRYRPPVGHVAPSAKGAKAGFVFMLLGSCAKPEYACTHVLELAEAIKSIRALALRPARPIAVLSDGGGPTHEWIWEHLKPDLVQPIRPDGQELGDDLRGRKLLAYAQSPFERTVFLDGDTYVRSARVEMLFDALQARLRSPPDRAPTHCRPTASPRQQCPPTFPPPSPSPSPATTTITRTTTTSIAATAATNTSSIAIAYRLLHRHPRPLSRRRPSSSPRPSSAVALTTAARAYPSTTAASCAAGRCRRA